MNIFGTVVCWLSLVAVVNGRLPPDAGTVDIDRADPTVDTVLSIVGQLGSPEELVKSWQGNDHCDWFGINCLDGIIRSIAFISMNLTGTISPRFADITSLRVIDLSHNSLTGTIPLELTKLNLTCLDVSYNQLHGKVPYFRGTVVTIAGNPDIETNRVFVPSSTRNKNESTVVALLIGIVVGLVVAGGSDFGFYLLRKRKQSNRLSEPSETVIMESESHVIPLQILRDATEDFCESNMVGKGGFGSVYKGKLQNGDVEIAVKRMEQGIGGKGHEEFKSEVSVLTKVHHRNLVVLHGYCLEGNERLLVYQYMPQGTLSRHLFHWKEDGLEPLEWTRRLTIALDVARGLEYLHNLARQIQSYIHRDLKPQNILLGDDMRAKVSDFGLARSTEEGRESIRTTKCLGTPGYIAPEYAGMFLFCLSKFLYISSPIYLISETLTAQIFVIAATGRVTTKADVYSFGVILMELVTGQEAIDERRYGDDHHIPTWFRKVFSDKESFEKAIDKTMELKEEDRSIINEVAKLAIHCCAKELAHRPEMGYVVSTLTSLTGHWKPDDIEEERDMEDTVISDIIKGWKSREWEGASSSSITVV